MPPGGECYNAFYKRALAYFRHQIAEQGDAGQEGALIIGNGRHAWALKRLLGDILGARTSTAPVKSGGEPYPGSLLEIKLPSLQLKPMYLAPAGDMQSL